MLSFQQDNEDDMHVSYDVNNIFAKIIRGELKCDILLENDYALSFNDIKPQSKHHILIIPKGFYIDLPHFLEKATNEELLGFFALLKKVLSDLKDNSGGLVKTNIGTYQEIKHLHWHIMFS